MKNIPRYRSYFINPRQILLLTYLHWPKCSCNAS